MRVKTGDRETLIYLKENEDLWAEHDCAVMALGLKNDDGNLEYCFFCCESSEEWEAILTVFFAIQSRTDTAIYDSELLLPDATWSPESIFKIKEYYDEENQ
jgi:hypothetical protein